MPLQRINKNFLKTIANSIERTLFIRVWTRRNPATGKYEARDIEYARSKYKPIFTSSQQATDFFLFLLLVAGLLTVLYFAAWTFFG